jgi:hypothetical protein
VTELVLLAIASLGFVSFVALIGLCALSITASLARIAAVNERYYSVVDCPHEGYVPVPPWSWAEYQAAIERNEDDGDVGRAVADLELDQRIADQFYAWAEANLSARPEA